MNKPADFNDLHLAEGQEAVRAAIAQAVPAVPPPPREDAWEPPLPFGRVETPELPADLLPGVFGRYVQSVADSLQTPSTMGVLFGLSVLSLALQRKFVVSPFDDEYAEPVCIWAVILADSGERKSALIQRLLKPVQLWEAKQAESMRGDIAEADTLRKIAQKRIEKLQADAAKEDSSVRRGELVKEIRELTEQTPEEKRAPRLFTGDVTPERLQSMLVEYGGKMAVMTDEGGIFSVLAGLYTGGEAYVDVFLQAYSGSPVRVDRGSRTAVIDRPALTFGLGMQPALFQDMPPAAKRKFRGSGLFARFFFGYPESRIGKRDMGRRVAISPQLEAEYRAAILWLLGIEAATGEEGDIEHRLTLNDLARESWVAFAQHIEDSQAEGGALESMRDWCAKLPGGALRVAGLFHVAEHGVKSLEIDESTMGRAIALCAALIPHAMAVFDLTGSDPTSDDAKLIWKWIERRGGPDFLRSELHRSHHTRFTKLERLVQALDILKGRNLISGPYKGPTTGGRPPVFYRVNPKALQEEVA